MTNPTRTINTKEKTTMTRQQYLEALNNNHQSVTVDWVNENFATEQRLGVDWVAD